MHGYIIILELPHMTSEARAYGISRELYNITVPLMIQEDYHKDGTVFGVVKHQDGIQCALHVDTEYVIPVHPLATLEKLVTPFLRYLRQSAPPCSRLCYTTKRFHLATSFLPPQPSATISI